MSLARQIPLLGILAGVALMIAGFVNSQASLVIVGLVLIALGIFRQIRNG
jgi:hypothetical protein